MALTIVNLTVDNFNSRVLFGDCGMNINGKTYDVEVMIDNTNYRNPTYTVLDKETKQELCTFRPYHMWFHSRTLYEIEGVGNLGAGGFLIVPELFAQDNDDIDLEQEYD